MGHEFHLLAERRFRPFFFTQFLGGFNDNVFKTTLVTLVVFHTAELSHEETQHLATLLPGLFMLPYFLFSATAGQLADKFERAMLIRFIKLLEIGIMLIAGVGFFAHNLWILSTALFLMGVHSTLFGPVKFAYLPQHLKEDELLGGNGLVEMGSFVAILLGQVLGAWMAMQAHHVWMSSLTVIGIAVLGYIFSREIPYTPAPDPKLQMNRNPFTETWYNLKFIWQHQSIWLAIMAISWFWFIGATLVAQFPQLAKTVLNGDESVFILILAVFSVGIGIGSLLCEKIARVNSGIGLVLAGAFGITIFTGDLYCSANAIQDIKLPEDLNYLDFVQQGAAHIRLLLDVAFVGLFGGLYIVPLYTLLQTRSQRQYLSRVIAGNNILNALFMVISALFSVGFLSHYSLPQLFIFTACMNVLMMGYLCWRQPEFWTAFLEWARLARPKH